MCDIEVNHNYLTFLENMGVQTEDATLALQATRNESVEGALQFLFSPRNRRGNFSDEDLDDSSSEEDKPSPQVVTRKYPASGRTTEQPKRPKPPKYKRTKLDLKKLFGDLNVESLQDDQESVENSFEQFGTFHSHTSSHILNDSTDEITSEQSPSEMLLG